MSRQTIIQYFFPQNCEDHLAAVRAALSSSPSPNLWLAQAVASSSAWVRLFQWELYSAERALSGFLVEYRNY